MSDTDLPKQIRVQIERGQNRLNRTAFKVKHSRFVQNLKRQIDENPVVVIVAVAAVIGATAKLINAMGHAKGSRAYAKQVDYRINKSK